MEYTITFELFPSGPFGVPQDGVTVVPSRPNATFNSDSFHRGTMQRVSYGSLSQYRSDEGAIDLEFNLGDVHVHLRDNYLIADVEALQPGDAFRIASATIMRYLKHLSLSFGGHFTAKAIILESADNQLHQVPDYTEFGRLTVYDLAKLRGDIVDAQAYLDVLDPRLDRAMFYIGHAQLLFEKRTVVANPLSEHYSFYMASVFLCLWKAVSAILGDSTKPEDSDRSQRSERLGLEKEFVRNRIGKMRELRNDYDVAHYSLLPGRVEAINDHYAESNSTATEVITRYRAYLRRGGVPF